MLTSFPFAYFQASFRVGEKYNFYFHDEKKNSEFADKQGDGRGQIPELYSLRNQ